MSWSSPLFDLAWVGEEEFPSDTVEGVVDVLVPYLGVVMESTKHQCPCSVATRTCSLGRNQSRFSLGLSLGDRQLRFPLM